MRHWNLPLILGIFLCSVLLIMVLFPSVLAPGDPHERRVLWTNPDTGQKELAPHPPSRHFTLGTDNVGRDMYTRLVWGARFTLGMGLAIAAGRFLIALVIGTIAGWWGGALEWLVRQTAIVMSGLPLLLLSYVFLVGMKMLHPDTPDRPLLFIWILVFLGWPRLTEQVRLLVKNCRVLAHVESARAAGATETRIVSRHVLPIVSPQLITLVPMEMAFALIVVGQLGVLGMHAAAPYTVMAADGTAVTVHRLPEWCQMLGFTRHCLGKFPWLPLVPASALAASVLGLNMLAEGVRRRLMSRMGRGVGVG